MAPCIHLVQQCLQSTLRFTKVPLFFKASGSPNLFLFKTGAMRRTEFTLFFSSVSSSFFFLLHSLWAWEQRTFAMMLTNCFGYLSPHCVSAPVRHHPRKIRCFSPVRLQTPPAEVQKYCLRHRATCSLATASFFTDQATKRVVFRNGFPIMQYDTFNT